MNKLPFAKRVQVISALMEGAGVNATVRMTGVSKPTIPEADRESWVRLCGLP
jgi:hypothetical protein